VRRIAHAHAGVSWKCQRVDVNWSRTTSTDDSDGPAAGDEDDDDDDADVTANFTALTHSLHAWY